MFGIRDYSGSKRLSHDLYVKVGFEGRDYKKKPSELRWVSEEEVGGTLTTCIDGPNGEVKEETQRVMEQGMVIASNGFLKNNPSLRNEYVMSLDDAKNLYGSEVEDSLSTEYQTFQKKKTSRALQVDADLIANIRQSMAKYIPQPEDESSALIPTPWGNDDSDTMLLQEGGLLVQDIVKNPMSVNRYTVYSIAPTELEKYEAVEYSRGFSMGQ